MFVEYVGDDVPKIIHVPSHCGPSSLDRPFVTRKGPKETIDSLSRAEERETLEYDKGNSLSKVQNVSILD